MGHKYWWVNHNQTFRSEIDGGYIWSPKQNSDGSRNQTYINLTLTNPGDIIFSYANKKIAYIGTITSLHREQGKPEEFKKTRNPWRDTGWAVPVQWVRLTPAVKPKDHIRQIAPLLPKKYSPLRSNGDGNQSCYLARISDGLGELILRIADPNEIDSVALLKNEQTNVVEESVESELANENLEETQKEQLVQARRGQGKFRRNVERIEKACRVTRETNPALLIASHIKPWRTSNNKERIDGYNGLLLAPHIDKLFDKGWISFSDDGDVLCYDIAAKEPLDRWGIEIPANVGPFKPKQCEYLAHHRKNTFKGL